MITAHAPTADPTERRFDIPVRRPFPWRAMLAYLGARLIPAAERIRGDVYVRTAAGGAATVAVVYAGERNALAVSVRGTVDPADTATRVRSLFIPAHDSEPLAMLATDAILGPRIARVPGLRPLGCWHPFELCVRTLVGQQVSVKAAQSLIARLVERCGAIEPGALAEAKLDGIGMPGRRVAAIQDLARAVLSGTLDLDLAWPKLERDLEQRPGFGPWTRAYLAIRLGRDPDAFPATDAGLLRASGLESPKALEGLAQRWRPWRAYAATYLWMVAPAAADAPR